MGRKGGKIGQDQQRKGGDHITAGNFKIENSIGGENL